MRMGITDEVDAEIYYTSSGANYSFFGLAIKYIIHNDPGSGWNFAVRPSYSTLLGVADMTYRSLAIDALASRNIGSLRPYVGATYLYGRASENYRKG